MTPPRYGNARSRKRKATALAAIALGTGAVGGHLATKAIEAFKRPAYVEQVIQEGVKSGILKGAVDHAKYWVSANGMLPKDKKLGIGEIRYVNSVAEDFGIHPSRVVVTVQEHPATRKYIEARAAAIRKGQYTTEAQKKIGPVLENFLNKRTLVLKLRAASRSMHPWSFYHHHDASYEEGR